VRGPVRCRKMPGPGGWNASRISASSQGDWHDGRRLGSFLHLLVTGRWLLVNEGTVGRSWLSGDSRPCTSERRAGR